MDPVVLICLIATNRIAEDTKALALAHQLRSAGHTVVAVAPDTQVAETPFDTVWVPWRWPTGTSRAAAAVRRILPRKLRTKRKLNALVSAARSTGASLFYPTTPDAVAIAAEAVGADSAVVRPPGFPTSTKRDLMNLAPSHPRLAAGIGSRPLHHIPGYIASTTPKPGRLSGRHIVLCYRKTNRNPGRYLEEALRDAGVDVMLVTDTLDWSTVPDDTSGVIFVESPLPPIDVRGNRKPVPVAFWVHHGELHLPTNLRLRRFYDADVVLLAHSWHLGFRFDVPVERFPFAVPVGLLDADRSWDERRFDVAFVGAVRGTYKRRRHLLDILRNSFGDRVAIHTDITPEEMARVYGDSRLVINEGGSRHLPITMRIFEAVGSGAFLLTDPVPGLNLILGSGDTFARIEDDLEQQIHRILDDPSTATRARAATTALLSRHTYAHRVDELFSTLDATRRSVQEQANLVTGDEGPEVQELLEIDIQRLVVFGDPGRRLGDLRDREVWDAEKVGYRLSTGNFEAVVLVAEPPGDLDRLLSAARRFIYADSSSENAVREWVASHRPDASLSVAGDFIRVDLHADAYRIN